MSIVLTVELQVREYIPQMTVSNLGFTFSL